LKSAEKGENMAQINYGPNTKSDKKPGEESYAEVEGTPISVRYAPTEGEAILKLLTEGGVNSILNLNLNNTAKV
jgi:hypothetical protein